MTNQVIPVEAVEAATDALIASKLGDHPGIYGEEFVEAAIAALEAAAPHMQTRPTKLTEWEACPKRHSAAAHFLDCEGEVAL